VPFSESCVGSAVPHDFQLRCLRRKRIDSDVGRRLNATEYTEESDCIENAAGTIFHVTVISR
jgi:hypothetical protein